MNLLNFNIRFSFLTQSLSVTECTEWSLAILGKCKLKIQLCWNNIDCFFNAYRSRRCKIQDAMSLLTTQPLYNHGLSPRHNISFSTSTTINFSVRNNINLNRILITGLFLHQHKTIEISLCASHNTRQDFLSENKLLQFISSRPTHT